jgi:hypothetical protein
MHDELREEVRKSSRAEADALELVQESRAVEMTGARRLAQEAERVHTLERLRLNGALQGILGTAGYTCNF